jgi:hypothetical protein
MRESTTAQKRLKPKYPCSASSPPNDSHRSMAAAMARIKRPAARLTACVNIGGSSAEGGGGGALPSTSV